MLLFYLNARLDHIQVPLGNWSFTALHTHFDHFLLRNSIVHLNIMLPSIGTLVNKTILVLRGEWTIAICRIFFLFKSYPRQWLD